MTAALLPHEIQELRDAQSDIADVLGDHRDNTGGGCRVDLAGHDCCYTCNRVEKMLEARRREALGQGS